MAGKETGEPGAGAGADFEALARRYWAAWGDAMRGAMPGAAPSAGVAGAQAWHDAIDWWTHAVHGNRAEVNQAVGRFNTQAQHWFGQMQQVAAQFAGHDAGAAEIARAWKQALGAAGENPFPEMFRGMRGQGLQGLEQWIEDASPWLGAWREQAAGWLRMPAFGAGREHQERAQRLAEAQLDVQQQTSAYNALMLKASQSAYEIFESKLAEREEPGRQLDSVRALFDLWIDAAEEAYAQIALSREFREVYGRLVNAQMRLRAGIQREVEQLSGLFGMPTRSELDGAHRKIAELERAMRRLRDATPAAPAGQGTPKPASDAQAKSETGVGAKKTSPKPKATRKRTGSKQPSAKRAAGSLPKKRVATATPKPRPARKLASAPAVRKAPTNGFSSLIPLPPVPLPPATGKPVPGRKR